jgi:hypothetical protein
MMLYSAHGSIFLPRNSRKKLQNRASDLFGGLDIRKSLERTPVDIKHYSFFCL